MGEEAQPVAIMIAGPNGAGKTTTAMTLFHASLKGIDFVNADLIAHGLTGPHSDAAAMEAGAIMLARLHALAGKRQNFAFEATGAARSFAPWLQKLKATGYQFHLYFLWLRGADTAVGRVAERVRAGGHHVPEDRIRSRYDAGLRNLFGLYIPIATTWQLVDNNTTPRVIADGSEGLEPNVHDAILWNSLKARYAQ